MRRVCAAHFLSLEPLGWRREVDVLQAVQNGDAVTVGQAWHSVRSGSLQPNDVDTLNALLK